ncbi:uncharacterized protein LOC115625812 [Scaptodrosophila lebanonensis]|uniref:Uncharacterized protein LOC115625812 n=1 Tax=Drosophila lebanonensis TaxID=7225 RepID=A0A6J2TLH2_DROLE|nr:uncharacterized protein LOC115625812 [Scaptodrosophila lebanonensis]
MNNTRILRTTNILLLLTGYQLHWFVAKSHRFRVSIVPVIGLVVLSCIYIACLVQHFEAHSLLQLVKSMSPFLHGLIRLQALLGVKVFIYAFYASARSIGPANDIAKTLPFKSNGSGNDRKDYYAYALIFSTLSVLFGLGFYIAYEMDFVLPPLEHIMIGLGLFIPHYVLGGALRFFNILSWLSCDQLQHLRTDVEEELGVCMAKQNAKIELASTSLATSGSSVRMEALQRQCQQLEQLAGRLERLFQAMQRSLILLFVVNSHCLLGGIYIYIYYYNVWYVLLEGSLRRVFYAGNILIYACILCDYIGLLLTQMLLQRERSKFLEHLKLSLSQREWMPKDMRSVVKDMRNILCSAFNFKFCSVLRFDVAHFALLQILQGLTIAVIVLYVYFNDTISAINDSIGGNDDE